MKSNKVTYYRRYDDVSASCSEIARSGRFAHLLRVSANLLRISGSTKSAMKDDRGGMYIHYLRSED
jgi:hypothetical protein